MKRLSLLLSLLLASFVPIMAQMPQTPYISWEDFVQEYVEENAADNEQALDEEQL